jgi:hypothetical protein
MRNTVLHSIYLALFVFSGLIALSSGEELRLNQLQAIGSHNSYHLAPPAGVLAVIGRFRKDAVEAWDYSHPPLSEQLSDAGIRQIELDIFADTVGGRFASPLGWTLANLAGAKLPPFDSTGVLAKPGFKILHVPDIDCWSNSRTLDLALTELATWSSAQADHLPVMVLVECKDEELPLLPTKPEPFTRERLLELDAAILKAIPREKLLLPDDIRGGEASLPDAIAKHGWPEIAKVRGKFLFALDNGGTIRDRYLEGNPALEERVLFVSAPDTVHPAAAWFKRNDPKRGFHEIQRLVKEGFIVRTRADSGNMERAFESGAQWVSTDDFSDKLPADKRVAFPGGKMVRPNLLTAGKTTTLSP